MAITLATVEYYGKVAVWSAGDSDDDNDIVVQTGSVIDFDEFELMSTTGVLDVFPSLDGTNYATAPLSLRDMGALSLNPVVVTVANRVYKFTGHFMAIRVQQASGVDTTAVTLVCGRSGNK